MTYSLRLLSLVFLLAACDDSAPALPASGDVGGSIDQGVIEADQGIGAVDQGVGSSDMAEPPMAEPAYVEAQLSPRRALYTLSDTPEVRFVVYDRIGREIPDASVVIDVQPAGQAEVDDDRLLRFIQEGAGAVRVCATPDICGRASFFVDDGPPQLSIESPERGEILTGEPEIRVIGQSDADPRTRVFVNDVPVEKDEAGRFEYTFRARFGLNRIDVVADDGVRRPAVRSVREVVWAPTVVPIPDGRMEVDDMAILRADQSLLDSGEDPPPVGPDGIQRLDDLSGLIQVIIARSDLTSLVDDVQISDTPSFNLRVEQVRPGNPDPMLLLTNSGMELFLRLEGVEILTSGHLDIQGERVGLGGSVFLDLAGFGSLRFEITDEGSPGFVVENVGLALENLTGQMDDSTAQAVVETVGSLLRTVLNQVAEQFMRTLIAEELPNFIALGIDDIIGPLRRIEIDQEGDGLVPPINVIVGFNADRPRFVRRDRFEIVLDGYVESQIPGQLPHPLAGIPAFPADASPVWPAQSAGVLAIRMLTLNALTTSMWRQGVLQIDLSEMIGGLLPQIDRLWLDARIPPLVVPSPIGSPNILELQIGEIDVFVENPANPEPDRYVMSLRVGLDVGIEDGTLQATTDEQLDVRVELVERGGDEPPLDPVLFRGIAQTQLGTSLTENLVDLIRVEIPPIELRLEAVQRFVPSLESVLVKPSFPERFTAQNGWLVLPMDGSFELVE